MQMGVDFAREIFRKPVLFFFGKVDEPEVDFLSDESGAATVFAQQFVA